MTDRELLELAAKAAGLQLCGYSLVGENEDDEECEVLEAAFVKLSQQQEIATMWNPLTDDGDALRLAVTLSFIDDGDWPAVTNEIYTHCNGDWFAATRRAITIAAAKVGREMK